jgi:hypothetical protein
MDDEPAAAAPAPAAGVGGAMGGLEDLFGGPTAAAPAPAAAALPKVALPADRGEGMQVRSAIVNQGGRLFQQITIENNSMAPLSGFAVQYNKNSFGLVPETPNALGQVLPPSIAPGQSASGLVPLKHDGQPSDSKGAVQMAIKNNVKVFYFQDVCDVCAFLAADGRLEKNAFLEQWRALPGECSVQAQGLAPAQENVDAVCTRLEAASIFFIARRKMPDGADMVYFSVKTLNGLTLLAEIGFRPGSGAASIAVKSSSAPYVPLLAESLQKLLKM